MQPSAELRDLLLRYYAAMSDGDIADIECLVDHEALAIGTDPAEWLSGAELWSVFRAQLAQLGGRLPVTAGEPLAYADGTAGWAADRPVFDIPGVGEIPVRLSVVFHRGEKGWRIVHTHASVGLPNDAPG